MADNRKSRRTHKWAFPLGMALIALAVVGFIALVRMGAVGIRSLMENPEEIAGYEKFLANIVVHDPDPFDDIEGVPDKNVPQLLDIALWSILQSDSNTPDQFSMDEKGRMQVPKAKVEEAFQKYFGILPPRHTSVEGADFDFIYDTAKEVYLVPITAVLQMYTPKVREVKKEGSSIYLTVDYLPAGDFKLDDRGRPKEPEAAKTMVIKLFERGKDKKGVMQYQVGAIRQDSGLQYTPGATVIG